MTGWRSMRSRANISLGPIFLLTGNEQAPTLPEVGAQGFRFMQSNPCTDFHRESGPVERRTSLQVLIHCFS